MGINITQQIEIIQRMVNEKFKVYLSDGLITDFQCKFYDPATIEEINKLEKDLEIAIPPDYKEFLLTTNGMYFMDMIQFYNLTDIRLIIESGIYKQGVYPIAYINGDAIIINSDDIICGHYIYAGGHDSVDEFISLYANFETFLDRLISINGRIYWDWYHHKVFHSFGANNPTSVSYHFINPTNPTYTEADLTTCSDDNK